MVGIVKLTTRLGLATKANTMYTGFSAIIAFMKLLLYGIFPLGLIFYNDASEKSEHKRQIGIKLMVIGTIYYLIWIGVWIRRFYQQYKSQQEYARYRQFRIEHRRMQEARRNGQVTWSAVV